MTGVIAAIATGAGFSVSVSLDNMYAFGSGLNISTAESTVATPTPPGFYNYSWVKQSGGDISALSPNSDTTAFRATLMSPSEIRSALFRCVVTQGALTVSSPVVAVTIERAA